MAEEVDGEGQEQGEEEEDGENRFGGSHRFDAEVKKSRVFGVIEGGQQGAEVEVQGQVAGGTGEIVGEILPAVDKDDAHDQGPLKKSSQE